MTKQIDKRFQIALLTVFLILVEVSLYAGSPVKIWQEKIVIPTYQVGKPDPNPRFYDGRVTQGAQGRVYPYPMSDVLLGNMEDQRYDIVYLENDFIKISVIPELGGRIFTAVDKTNDYDFFYRQSVIKPALIGTLGKWISGGSEWNFPHHHKTTTMMRMDHYLEQPAWTPRSMDLPTVKNRDFSLLELPLVYVCGCLRFPLLTHAMLVLCIHECNEFSCLDPGMCAHARSDPNQSPVWVWALFLHPPPHISRYSQPPHFPFRLFGSLSCE